MRGKRLDGADGKRKMRRKWRERKEKRGAVMRIRSGREKKKVGSLQIIHSFLPDKATVLSL